MTSRALIIGHRPRDLYEAWSRRAYFIPNASMPVEHGLRYPDSQGAHWNSLYWSLFFRGDVFTEAVKSIKISESAEVSITTRFGTHPLGFRPSQILISCLDKIDAPQSAYQSQPGPNKVFDFFEVNKGTEHDMWNINTGDKHLVNQVQFYLTDRIDGNLKKKDLFAVSTLNDEELRDFDYSDTMVRFKLESILGELLPGSVKIKHFHRLVRKTAGLSVAADGLLGVIPGPDLLTGFEIGNVEQSCR